jgi:hypothetical protein
MALVPKLRPPTIGSNAQFGNKAWLGWIRLAEVETSLASFGRDKPRALKCRYAKCWLKWHAGKA